MLGDFIKLCWHAAMVVLVTAAQKKYSAKGKKYIDDKKV